MSYFRKLHGIEVPAWARDWIVNQAGTTGLPIKDVVMSMLVEYIVKREQERVKPMLITIMSELAGGEYDQYKDTLKHRKWLDGKHEQNR